MQKGYHYFGIRIGDKLAGLYKAIITEKGLLGEHQAVDPDFRGQRSCNRYVPSIHGFLQKE